MSIASKIFALVLVLLMALSSFLLICSAPVGLAQSVNESPAFTISIVASINGYSSTCVFGVNPDSGTIFSSKYDSLASYPNSGVYIYFRYYDQTTFHMEKLSQYIVPSNGNTTWSLEVESIDQEGILTLAWNVPPVSSLILEDGITRKVYADMNAVSNFSFRTVAGDVLDFYIVYQSATATTPTPTPTPSPSPSPTATSSPATTPTPTPYQEPQQTEQLEMILGVAIVVIVIATGLGLLIYLIKRK